MFPGKKAGTAYSFSNPSKECKEHEVTNPPATGKYPNCTIAQYSNIEHGEKLGERPGKIHHVSHKS